MGCVVITSTCSQCPWQRDSVAVEAAPEVPAAEPTALAALVAVIVVIMVVIIVVVVVLVVIMITAVGHAGLGELAEHLAEVGELGLHLLLGVVVRVGRVPGCGEEGRRSGRSWDQQLTRKMQIQLKVDRSELTD